MLAEHLSQAHDHASRRTATVDTHVDWIHRIALSGRTSRILDLGCGPGLYTSRLTERGHSCVGIDFGPASIEYVTTTNASRLDCTYQLGDIREAESGSEYDLVMLTFGEFNVFRPADARSVLTKCRQALVAGGRLVLEVHSTEAVQRIGTATPSWRSAVRGLFSDRPHLWLDERFWDEDQRVATERYYVIDAKTGSVSRYAQSMQAYTDDEYRAMLRGCGLELNGVFPSLSGADDGGDFYVLMAIAG